MWNLLKHNILKFVVRTTRQVTIGVFFLQMAVKFINVLSWPNIPSKEQQDSFQMRGSQKLLDCRPRQKATEWNKCIFSEEYIHSFVNVVQN